MLWHLEALVAAGKFALIESYGKVTLQMLPQFRISLEALVTVYDRAREVLQALAWQTLGEADEMLPEEDLLLHGDEVLLPALRGFVIVYL